ncbi:hypothetical protein [Desertivibrio insolitus]|uniref:hypothetical protein n=1 Tax=Herbiconiux sp. SYSU D00978 TaxID=2812562 RepID=UPI001A95CE1C|nr:hypothetical protein [Herbiconiux sp. SYSU D00978]
MTDIRASRCEELRQAITELTPLVIEGQADATKLTRALPSIARVRAVAALGADGVDDEAYRVWAAGAERNLEALQDAATRGDGRATWAAFTDREAGVALLAQGCAGAPGW